MLREILGDQKLVHCLPDAKVSEAAQLMADNNVGDILVLSNGKPRGILTDRDIVIRCVAANLDVNDTTVENVMTESLTTAHQDEGIFDCIRKMDKAKVRRIPVVNNAGDAIGIISFGDLLKVLAKEFVALVAHTTPAEYDEELKERKAA